MQGKDVICDGMLFVIYVGFVFPPSCVNTGNFLSKSTAVNLNTIFHFCKSFSIAVSRMHLLSS